MDLRHRHRHAARHAGDRQENGQRGRRESERPAGLHGLRGTLCRGHRGARPQREGKGHHRRYAKQAHAHVRRAPAVRLEEMLQHRRPDRAAEVVAARADADRHATVLVEPERRVGDQRREARRAAEQADQQPVRKRELHHARGVRGRHEAQADAHRADQHRHHDTEAVGEASHEDAAQPEADHGERVGEGRVGARDLEIRLHERQRHRHGVHADAADGHERERRGQAQAGVQRLGLPGQIR